MFLLSPLFGGYEDGVKWMGKMNRNCYQNQSNAFGTWERGQCSTPCSRQLNWPWIMFAAVLKQILRFSVFFPHMSVSTRHFLESFCLFISVTFAHASCFSNFGLTDSPKINLKKLIADYTYQNLPWNAIMNLWSSKFPQSNPLIF